MAMVETYLYGLETGKWAKESEFVKANKGKFSRAAFESARVFCGLDEAIRAFVFSGAIKYGPVVELGKTVRPHREYLAQKFFSKSDQEELTPEEKIKIEEEVIQWNACQIALIQRQNLNITAARQLFAGFCKNWEEALEDLRRNDQEKGQATFDMADPDQEWLAQRKETRKKLRESVTALAQLPASSAFRALQLHVEIMNPDSDEASQMLEVIGSGVRKVDTKLQQVIAGNVGSLALGV